MIITLKSGERINTETDLSAAERHIIQKLMIWKTIVTSEEAFAEKIRKALAAGWNGSGPVRPGPAASKIISEFKDEIYKRR